jgi:hypothetical protein
MPRLPRHVHVNREQSGLWVVMPGGISREEGFRPALREVLVYPY